MCNDHIIIGEGPLANYTRYINHSSKRPNAFLITSTRWKTARFEAIEEIKLWRRNLFQLWRELLGKLINVWSITFISSKDYLNNRSNA